MLTFQIALHLDDLTALEFVKEKLRCGKISKVDNRCNFFVNDAFSLINIIVPVFNTVRLNSSKFSQFESFEKAVRLLKNNSHLTFEGKITIKYLKDRFKIDNKVADPRCMTITHSWLLGFIEGDASFSTAGFMQSPIAIRLKFENHVREFELQSRSERFKDS